MEQKLQDHHQEMEKLAQDWQLEKERIVYQTKLKLEAEEVSRALCIHTQWSYIVQWNSSIRTPLKMKTPL